MLGFWLLLYNTLLTLTKPGVALLHVLALSTSVLFVSHHLILTTDPPAALGWMAALAAAVRAEKKPLWWSVALGLVGVTMLSKYTALTLLLGFGVFTVVQRRAVFTKENALGALLFALALSPVILWNINNGWVNLGHNATHVASGKQLRPQYLFELLLGQLGLIGPLFLPYLLSSVARAWKSKDSVVRLALFSSLPLLALCLGVSVMKPVYANWPMPIYIGFLLVSARLFDGTPRTVQWLRRSIATNLALLLPVLLVYSGVTFGIPPKILPTKKLVGWDVLGERVEAELAGISGESFVLTENYDVASTVAFYAPSHPPLLCWVFDGRRMNQYDVWGGFAPLKGRSAVIVVKNPENMKQLRPHFRSLTPLGEPIVVQYSGQELRRFFLYRGEGFDGSSPQLPVKR
jgi:hypothetical protein